MDFYTSETDIGESIIRMSKKEAKILMDMLEFASENNKRKPTFKKMYKSFSSNLACY